MTCPMMNEIWSWNTSEVRNGWGKFHSWNHIWSTGEFLHRSNIIFHHHKFIPFLSILTRYNVTLWLHFFSSNTIPRYKLNLVNHQTLDRFFVCIKLCFLGCSSCHQICSLESKIWLCKRESRCSRFQVQITVVFKLTPTCFLQLLMQIVYKEAVAWCQVAN